jgi:hypothetical protein
MEQSLLEKLIVAQLVKKFLAVYGTRRLLCTLGSVIWTLFISLRSLGGPPIEASSIDRSQQSRFT